MYKSRRAPKQRQDARKPSFRTRCVRLRRPADVPPPPSQRPVAPRRSQRLRKDSAANGEDLSSRLRLALRESVAEVFEEAAAIDWLFRTGKTAKMGSVERKRAEGVEGGRFEPIPPEKWVYRTPDKGQSLPKVGKSGESKMIPVLLRTTNRCKTLYQLDEQEGFRKVLRGDGINIGNARRIASFVTSRDESDAMRVQVSPLLNTMYEEEVWDQNIEMPFPNDQPGTSEHVQMCTTRDDTDMGLGHASSAFEEPTFENLFRYSQPGISPLMY